MNKYKNTKVEADGYKFASKIEYSYYKHLLEQQKQGVVKSFEMQVPFILLEGYELNGRKVRPIKLVLDFVVEYADGSIEYHDTKGIIKPGDVIKKKMFESKYGKELIFIGKSIVDGGFVNQDIIKEGRKKRKQLKLSKK